MFHHPTPYKIDPQSNLRVFYNVRMAKKDYLSLTGRPFTGSKDLIGSNYQTMIALKLYIKNMVCIRCKMVVKDELTKLRLHCTQIELGEANTLEEISGEQRDQIRTALLKSGLELLDDRKSILIQKIKNVIIEAVHYSEDPPAIKLSEYLSQKLNHDYTYLANIFSEVQGTTIAHFFIAHRIERVKELLVYDELTLNQIADKLHYCNAAHLSNQFKKVCGLTPSHFKQLRNKRRSMLEDL